MLKTSIWMGALLLTTLAADLPAGLAKEKRVDVAAALEAFSKAWPADRTDYRTSDDTSWKTYARTLRTVVGAGDVDALTKGLAHDNRQVRALCARALGFLGKQASVKALAKSLAEDDWATARLLAADSLGAICTDAARKALGAAKEAETSRDVRLHIDIALRREQVLDAAPRKALLSLTAADLDTATVGKPAPAFELETPTGTKVTLADYRGKRNVVLVFIYGDG